MRIEAKPYDAFCMACVVSATVSIKIVYVLFLM